MNIDEIKGAASLLNFYDKFREFKEKIPEDGSVVLTIKGSPNRRGYSRSSSITIPAELNIQTPDRVVMELEDLVLDKLFSLGVDISSLQSK